MSIQTDLGTEDFKTTQIKAVVNIMFTGYWLTSKINRTLDSCGLTEPQYNVLAIVYAARGGPVSLTFIKERMIQRESNVSRIVDRLVDREWITRNNCPKNRRKVDIAMTVSGRRTFQHARLVVTSFHRDLENRLSDMELEQLSDYLDKLRME